jgi:peptide/nickel transport system permease protein
VIQKLRQRSLRALLVAWGVSLTAFAVVRLVPGDPVLTLLGDQATPEAVAQLRRALHLEGPLPEQYLAFLTDILRGDLGASIVTRQPVLTTIGQTLPVTLWLTGLGIATAIAIALPLGVLGGATASATYLRAFRVVSSVVIAFPVFVSGLVLLLVVGVQLRWLPVAGYAAFPDNLRYLALPALAMGLPNGMIFARILQQSVRETSREEFVEAGIVWGLPRRELVLNYLVRPSLAPTIGLMGYVVGASLASAVILETVFNLPGVGTFLVRGVLARDYPVVQGTLFVFGIIVVAVHFVADTVAAWIDPRVGSPL